MAHQAYVKSIEITDEDSEVIGHLNHDVDEIYHFVSVEGTWICAEDYRFIATVLESDLISTVIGNTNGTD